MRGNAYQWVWDWHTPRTYRSVNPQDTTGRSIGTHRVLRGGGFRNDANRFRVSNRNAYVLGRASNGHGY